MQIANGLVILSPENQQHKHGITPAEALILFKMHFAYANGSPLGTFFIQPGEAVTVDVEGKPAEEEWFNSGTGKMVPAKPEVPAKTHKRTQAEEIARLKKKYTGNVTVDGKAMTAFAAVFGTGRVMLPETFEEIEESIGGTPDNRIFKDAKDETAVLTRNHRSNELSAKLRADLCEMAIKLKLKVHAQDSKESIIAAIIEAEAKAAEAAADGPGEPPKE